MSLRRDSVLRLLILNTLAALMQEAAMQCSAATRCIPLCRLAACHRTGLLPEVTNVLLLDFDSRGPKPSEAVCCEGKGTLIRDC